MTYAHLQHLGYICNLCTEFLCSTWQKLSAPGWVPKSVEKLQQGTRCPGLPCLMQGALELLRPPERKQKKHFLLCVSVTRTDTKAVIVWEEPHGLFRLTAQHCEGERQTQAQRQKEAHEPRAQAFKQINILLSRSKLSIRADSWLCFTPSMLQSLTPVIASNDVSVGAAVTGEYKLSEGFGGWGGAEFMWYSKTSKEPGGTVRWVPTSGQTALHQKGPVKLPLPRAMIDLGVVCITPYIPKVSSIF